MPASSHPPIAGHESAGGWMHRGIDLLHSNPADLEEAVRCFDHAIALRRALATLEKPHDRYLLAGSWLNRGDALARMGGDDQLSRAMVSYDEALALLRGLPLREDPLFPRRLAIAWINRGNAVSDAAETVHSFREALAVLDDDAAAAIADRALLRAGAQINLAGSLLNISDPPIPQARQLARQAISLLKESERNDLAAAEAGFKARHILCRTLAAESRDGKTVPPEFIAAATDVVDEGLALARHWEQRGEVSFRGLAADLFRFGCRLYQPGPAQFLAEFILANLDPEKGPGVLPLDRNTHAAAVAALWNALSEIQRDGFASFSTPRFEQVLENLRALRVTEERLNQLRRTATA